MAKGEVLQIVVFAFLFGTACATIGAKAEPVVKFCESLSEVMFKYTAYIMYAAPLGVFGAMAATIGDKGLGVLLNLGKLVATLYAAEIFFVVVVLGSVVAIARIPLKRFIQHVRGAVSAGVFDGVERGGAALGAGKHGEDGRAEAHCGVRAADRV